MVQSILMVLPELRAHLRAADAESARCFQFLAFDIIYDGDDGRAWVEEVNTNGFLGGGMVEVPRGRAHLRSMLELAGVVAYDRHGYAATSHTNPTPEPLALTLRPQRVPRLSTTCFARAPSTRAG